MLLCSEIELPDSETRWNFTSNEEQIFLDGHEFILFLFATTPKILADPIFVCPKMKAFECPKGSFRRNKKRA